MVGVVNQSINQSVMQGGVCVPLWDVFQQDSINRRIGVFSFWNRRVENYYSLRDKLVGGDGGGGVG